MSELKNQKIVIKVLSSTHFRSAEEPTIIII